MGDNGVPEAGVTEEKSDPVKESESHGEENTTTEVVSNQPSSVKLETTSLKTLGNVSDTVVHEALTSQDAIKVQLKEDEDNGQHDNKEKQYEEAYKEESDSLKEGISIETMKEANGGSKLGNSKDIELSKESSEKTSGPKAELENKEGGSETEIIYLKETEVMEGEEEEIEEHEEEGGEEPSEIEMKKEEEIENEKGIKWADTKESKSEIDERKSDASLSSAELLAAEEKTAMAQQYEILAKLRSEHVALKKRNFFLNNKLVQYFKKQKMDHVFAETKEDPALEEQYLRKLTLFYETNQQMNEEKLKINTEWETQRSINEALKEKVDKSWKELFSRKRDVAAKLIDPKTGRTVPCDKTIEDLLNRQETQLKLLSECRLAQIKLKRRIESKKLERQMQHTGEQFNLMEYEKLSSLKEYFMDQITERDIEIEEVNKKMAAMDDTLTQLKEQLHRKEDELEQEQERLNKITLELNNKREHLNVLKSTRHKTEKNTAKIKQQSGLLAYPILLKDYEEKVQQLQLLMAQTAELRQVHRSSLARIRKLRETVTML